MKNNWWKVTLYCLLTSMIGSFLEARLLSSWWGRVQLPESLDRVRRVILSGVIFVVIVLLGGLVFFRKMTRRELFYSATVLVAVNIVMGILANAVPNTMFAVYWLRLTERESIASHLLLDVNEVLAAIVSWVILPYVFVLFGKREDQPVKEC